jgi:hypothetical protein
MDRSGTTLTAFFEYNRLYAEFQHLLYAEFPRYLTYNYKERKWKKRVRCIERSIGCMYHCSPVSSERFYLQLLLTKVREATSHDFLYIVDDVTYPSYRAACIARGLAEDDREWVQCFKEAKNYSTSSSLRTLFLIGLRQRLIADPLEI